MNIARLRATPLLALCVACSGKKSAGTPALNVVTITATDFAFGAPDTMLIYAACALVFVAAFVLLLVGDRLFSFMGRSGLQVFTRVMGLILAALAVQFVVNGASAALPGRVKGL